MTGGDFYLHDLASDEAKYISEETFEDLLSGDATEEDADVSPGAWCTVKLEYKPPAQRISKCLI